jgi:hypothetical protein
MVIRPFTNLCIVDFFQCQLVRYVYGLDVLGSKWVNQSAFYVSTAALNLFTDLILSIPTRITMRLQAPIQRKIVVYFIICPGGVQVNPSDPTSTHYTAI